MSYKFMQLRAPFVRIIFIKKNSDYVNILYFHPFSKLWQVEKYIVSCRYVYDLSPYNISPAYLLWIVSYEN
jgi:hypothetical protein